MRLKKPVFLAFKSLMSIAYLSLGVVILFSNNILLPVNSFIRVCFGILLVLYGSFRIYTLLAKTKNDEAN